LTSSVAAQSLALSAIIRETEPKNINEVWCELVNKTFATPTFDELGELHEGYSFDEIFEMAQYSNPSLLQFASRIAAASGKRTQAGLYPNPILIYGGDNLGVHGEAGKHGLAITQEFVTARKKKLDKTAASYDVSAARKEYSMAQLKLQNDLRIAYYEMIRAILICKVENFAHELSKDLLKVAKTMHADGKSRAIDVLQFQTTLNAEALDYKQAENNKLAKWQNLISIAGVPNLPYRPVRGSLIDHSPRRNWQTTWTQLQNESPQLELAKLKIAQARVISNREKAEQFSNVYATFSLARDIPAKATVPFVGIGTPLKIYNKNQGNIAKANAEIAIANREFDRISLQLHKKLANAFCKYDNACEVIQVYEKTIIPDSFEALRQIGENYCNEKMTYLELYTQRKIVINVLLKYIEALESKAIATTQINGMMLEGILE
jgi:outer membrane protein TolC